MSSNDDIQWDEEIVWDKPASKPAPVQRRETTAGGIGAESLKGATRGLYNLGQAAERFNPVHPALILLKQLGLPVPDIKAGQEQIQNTLQAAPNASVPEQMLGTGAELATGMLPFVGAGPAGLIQKAMSVAVPTAGGVAGEQVIGGEAGKLIGSLAAPTAQVLGSRVLTPKLGPPKPPTAQQSVVTELHEANIPVLPSQNANTGAIQRNLEAYGGSTALAKSLRVRAQPSLQNLAAKETGLSPQNLTEKALSQASRQISEETYQPVRALQNIYLGRQTPFQRELSSIADEFKAVDQAPNILKRIDSFRVDELPADATLKRIAQLRSDASEAFQSGAVGGRTYGQALRRIADAIEDQIERNLPKGSKVLENYREGRTKIAKNAAVRDMLVDRNSGMIDATKAHALLEQGTKLTGGLETIAKAGSPAFAATTKPPIGAEPTVANWRDWGLFGTPVLARAAVKSKLGQWAAARDPKKGPSIFGNLTSDVLQQYPGVVSPFFSQGEQ